MKIITCNDKTCVVNVIKNGMACHESRKFRKKKLLYKFGNLAQTETKRGNLQILEGIRTVFYFLRGRASWVKSEIDLISKNFFINH